MKTQYYLLLVFVFLSFTAKSQEYAYEKLITKQILAEQDEKFKAANAKPDNPSEYIQNRFLGYGVYDKPTWKVLTRNRNKYKVRIFIIGESTCRNYMSLYGYPEKTTPFLDKVNGTFYSNFVSCSANTVQTLTRALLALDKKAAQHEHTPTWNSPNSVVTLANAVGYTTYFISGQDITGVYDAANTNIALKSNYYTNEPQKSYKPDSVRFEFFPPNVNENNHNGEKYNDLNLLYKFKDALDFNPNEDKMIFLHLWGPHAAGGGDGSFSNKDVMDGYDIDLPHFNSGYGHKVDYYLKGIYTSDYFIKSVYEELKSRGVDFSIMYMSDHGHDQDRNPQKVLSPYEMTIHHNAWTQYGYNIPFVVLNSDDTKRKFEKKPLSQFYLIDLFADWLGVTTNLTDSRFTLKKYPDHPIKVWNLQWGSWDYDDLFKSKILYRKTTDWYKR